MLPILQAGLAFRAVRSFCFSLTMNSPILFPREDLQGGLFWTPWLSRSISLTVLSDPILGAVNIQVDLVKPLEQFTIEP